MATSPTVFAPESGSAILIANLVDDSVSAQDLARKVDAFEVGLPPPDLLTLHGALRI